MRENTTERLLFCDLDGVLANFEKGVKDRTGKFPNELNKQEMWRIIKSSSRPFFNDLEWMPEGHLLWEKIKKYQPIILTGCPMPNGEWAEEQKYQWCARELGPDTLVLTCATKDKPKYCLSGSVLIDDMTIIRDEWIANGGKYITYCEGDLDTTLKLVDRYMQE
jgi:hypothetical protein